MPLIEISDYKPPLLIRNCHLQTIYPSLFRKVKDVVYTRERIITPDMDFLDIDWSVVGSKNMAVISHGLEGNSERSYVLGMVKALNREGWDVAAWNFRGCSGEPNKQPFFYHSGASYDLETVVNHILQKKQYQSIVLIGFSMGGNITLKYLGEKGDEVPQEITKSVAISVPCHLASASEVLGRWYNKIYMKRFLLSLREKIRSKMPVYGFKINDKDYHKIKNFRDFDNRYTAPLHGFKDAEDYWEKSSSLYYLEHINVPTLMINALDDPFLSEKCYPIEIAGNHRNLFLETPKYGGHVGFVLFNSQGLYWSEKRTIQFINYF